MNKNKNKRYLKYFYISEFLISSALGMIPLMTVLSYMLSTLSNSTLAYAVVLALYNVSTTIPKVFVAKTLSNRSTTFKSLLVLRGFQLLIWLSMSFLFSVNDGESIYIILFCALYLLYALIKGSVEVLNLDIYSRVISRTKLGKFYGFKYSLNSFAEFLGALILIPIFGQINIVSNYAPIFMIVFVLDALSFISIYTIKNRITLKDESTDTNYGITINDEIAISNGVIISKSSKNYSNGKMQLRKNLKHHKNNLLTLKEEILTILKTDSIYSSFIKANIISIIGASVASFFIPYGTDKLNLTLEYISIANVIWLVSKIISSIFWGYIVDLIGSKYVMMGSRIALVFSYILAINLNSVKIFYVMIFLHGISSSALVIMSQNIFIEISNNKGPLYSAINSVLCMPFFVVMPLFSSFVSENYGYNNAFKLSLIPLIISLFFMNKMDLRK